MLIQQQPLKVKSCRQFPGMILIVYIFAFDVRDAIRACD
jgi:hypothetical protein